MPLDLSKFSLVLTKINGRSTGSGPQTYLAVLEGEQADLIVGTTVSIAGLKSSGPAEELTSPSGTRVPNTCAVPFSTPAAKKLPLGAIEVTA